MIFVTIMSWNTPIPKVICSVSDSFLERSALNVNGLFSGSALFLKWNLLIIALESSLGFFYHIKTNTQYVDPIRCEQVNYVSVRSSSTSLSTVHIVSDRFPNRTENRSGIV